MAIKIYTKEYAGLLAKITEKKSYFLRAFGGQLQVKDGVKDSDTFLYLKTSDTPVVMQKYSTDENVAFGTGTGNSNRFGPRNEIKSVDTSVPYEAPMSIHEGVDDFTVNDIPDQVVAERLEEQGIAWAEYVDTLMGKALSAAASETLDFDMTEEGVTKLFSDAHKKFINNKVSKTIPWVAYVNTEIYDLLIDSKLATTAKNSSANIDEQTLYKFKGFILIEMPEDKFQTDEQAQFSADGVGIAGVGISVTRTIDSEDFNGVAIQGAGKYGKYIPDRNKVAILKGAVKKSVAPAPNPVTGLKMSQATASMKVGDTKQITAVADPSNGDDAKTVNAATTYSSSDESIATVGTDGTITAVAEGTATITATSGSFTATCKVTNAAA